MKKVISFILVLCMVLSLSGSVLAEDAGSGAGYPYSSGKWFTTVKIPFPDTIEDRNSWLTRARYKDSGEVIPLSMSYNGSVYATVPIENANREIEAFVPEEIQFADNDDSDSNFHDFRMLSRVGVIKGNEKGEANIYDNVTRAEAVAMVLRFLGLNKVAMQGTVRIFDDVTSDKWYYREVLSAYNYGLIKGDSEKTFSPERDVTREEITVMVARALEYANLRCSKSSVTNYADEDKISDWAKDAYEFIGQNIVSDYDNTDLDNPVRILNPQKAATRADVAYILNNAQDDCQLYASELAEMFGFDKEMPVIDGSTSTYPFTQAVYGALFCNGETHPRYPQKHSKSHASYQRLINGEVDMLFASVYPASDILKMAEEKGVELELIPIAYDAMIFFTNKDNPATGLTTEQISNIYVNDAYDNWSEVGGPDALMYPYCRNNDSGSHAQMEKHFLNGNEINTEVQRETSETMSDILTDVMAAKTDNPVGYGLGYSIYYYYHNMRWFYPVEEELKLLAIDGVMPTNETIADGSYPLSNNTYVVLRKDTPADAPARKMAEFMLTEAGQVCVEMEMSDMTKKTVSFNWLKNVAYSAAALAVAFVLTFNCIPSLAYAASDVPILGDIVRVVTFGRFEVQEENYDAKVNIPKIEGLLNKDLENKLNKELADNANTIITAFENDIRQMEELYGDKNFHLSVNADYIVKTNNEDILAVDFYFTTIEASSVTSHRFYNIDKKAGTLITLDSLFKKNADYITPISNYILDEMKNENENNGGFYFLDGDEDERFTKIRKDQNFYINNDGNLVICFDEYEIAAGAQGSPEFVIPDDVIAKIVK